MNNPLRVQLKLLDPKLPVPTYAHPGDAGADLYARVDVQIAPHERKMVPTGIAIALPDGYVGLVHPRSGLAAREGLSIVNSPGTIDSGYRGEIKVCLINTDPEKTISLRRGDKIAHLVIQRFWQADFEITDNLGDTERGEGGYGSTGGVTKWGEKLG